ICFVNGYEQRLRQGGFDAPALWPRTGCVLEDASGAPRKAMIVYSLGNFVTAMYTRHCRTGLIFSLRLARDQHGRVDWHQPAVRLAYNARWNPLPGRRRLMLLEDFLRHCDERRYRVERVRRLASWLHGHLLGAPQ